MEEFDARGCDADVFVQDLSRFLTADDFEEVVIQGVIHGITGRAITRGEEALQLAASDEERFARRGDCGLERVDESGANLFGNWRAF